MREAIKVDIWSDVACPWCYVGKRNFEAGVAAFREGNPDVAAIEVTYRAYELSPDVPLDFECGEVEYLVESKGIGPEQVRQMHAQIEAAGSACGIEFHFDRVRHTNTSRAHQLLLHARDRGKQLEMVERLMRAYFSEGHSIATAQSLADLAAEVGLDRDDVIRSLSSEEYLPAVRADQEAVSRYRIRSVPFFVFNDRAAISGAHPAATFASELEQLGPSARLASG